jgi:ElaA protein
MQEEMLQWKTLPFNELSLEELYQILALRQEIFIVEQTCPYPDADGLDQQALHLFATDPGNKIVAYCRIFHPGVIKEESVIGRVVVHQSFRGTGLGRILMQNAIDYLYRRFPEAAIKISAQSYLRRFYSSLGFEVIGDEYLEDDIPHLPMLLKFS